MRASRRAAVTPRAPALILVALALTAGSGCASFTPLEAGVCGNAVIDPDEDCDTHGTEPGTRCGAADTATACRFVCGGSDGAVCPSGSGCGKDGICRAPSGRFSPLGELVPFASPRRIAAADFDGDGMIDLLLAGDEDALGRTPARLVFPARSEGASRVLSLPTNVATPIVGHFDPGPGEVSDVAFSDLEGVSIFHAHDARSPYTAFPSLLEPMGTFLRVIPMDVIPSQPGDEIVTFVDRKEAGTTLERPGGDPSSSVLTALPGGEDELAGDITWGLLDEGAPCAQIVLAYRGAEEVHVFTPCRVGPSGITWNVGGSLQSIALPPGAKVDRGVILADLDFDQHLDLLIGASKSGFVAWGDGDGTFRASKPGGAIGAAGPYELPAVALGTEPLAVGDLDGDGAIDFVLPGGVVLSKSKTSGFTQINTGSPWTHAVVADLNADGLLDVAAGTTAALDIDIFINAGGGVLNPSVVMTDGPTAHFVVGDLDGDLVADLAFTQAIEEGDDHRDDLTIAFGAALGWPSSPVVATSLAEAEQMVPAHLAGLTGTDGIVDLAVVSQSVAGTDAMFALRGNGARSLKAPLPLGDPAAPDRALALAAGSFGGGADLVALSVDPATVRLRLWQIPTSEEITFDRLQPSEFLSASFRPVNPVDLINFRFGAFLAVGDLDGDGKDEAVVLAPYGSQLAGAAVVIADYDAATFTFAPRPEQPLAAQLSIRSTLRLLDLDGDGHLDALITTGTAQKPADLLILWGGGGSLDTADPVRVSIPGGAVGHTCLPAAGGGCALVAASSEGIFRVEVGRDRGLAVAPIEGLSGGRGVAAGDFDGDGVVDLAVLVEGGLTLQRAEPVRP